MPAWAATLRIVVASKRDIDGAVAGDEACKALGKPTHRHGWRHRHDEPGAECVAADFARDAADLLEGHAQPGQHFHSAFAQHDAPVDAMEQLAAHLLLDGADELADGSRRDRQLLRRRGKAARARRSLEGLQSFQRR